MSTWLLALSFVACVAAFLWALAELKRIWRDDDA